MYVKHLNADSWSELEPRINEETQKLSSCGMSVVDIKYQTFHYSIGDGFSFGFAVSILYKEKSLV